MYNGSTLTHVSKYWTVYKNFGKDLTVAEMKMCGTKLEQI